MNILQFWRDRGSSNKSNSGPIATTSSINANNPPTKEEQKQSSEIAYFNNAGKTALPQSSYEAGIQALRNQVEPWNLGADADTPKVRELFAKLLNADPDGSEIAICPSTGFSLTMIAHNLLRTGCIGKDKNVLVLQDGMSSEIYCWQEVCGDSSGACLDIVVHPLDEHGWTKEILERIKLHSSTIGVVCIPQVHWSDGSLLDLKLVGEACRQHDIKLVVDGTQSVGIYPFSVREIQCDALAVSVHKWLLGPVGMSLVYIDKKYHDTWLPLDQHERARVVFQNDIFDAGENTLCSDGYPTEFIDGAARCDAGGKKNPLLMPMVRHGLEVVNDLDLMEAQSKLKLITDEVLEGAKSLGFGVQPGPRAGHIIGLRPVEPELRALLTPEKMVEIATRLKQKGVILAPRSGAFRISPYLDTTSDNVKRLLTCLGEELKQIET